MARLAVAHTRAVTKAPPHRREGWKIRVGSFDSPPFQRTGSGKLLYPTVNQDGEVIAGWSTSRRLLFPSSVRMPRRPGAIGFLFGYTKLNQAHAAFVWRQTRSRKSQEASPEVSSCADCV